MSKITFSTLLFWLGVCDYQRSICDAFYVHNKTLSVIGTGSNGVCQSIIHHSTSTSPRPLSNTETRVFEAIARGIDSRLLRTQSSGTEVSEAIKIFSKQDHTHGIYIRNPNCWAHDLDLINLHFTLEQQRSHS